MAVSSTTATVCIPGNKVQTTQAPKFGISNRFRFSAKPRKFCIRSSSASDFSSDSTATSEADSESAIDVPIEPPSLISALNVERVLRGIRNSFFLFIESPSFFFFRLLEMHSIDGDLV